MPKHLRIPLATTLAVALLPILAACGGSSSEAPSTASASTSGAGSTTKSADGATQLSIPDGTDAATKKKYIVENTLASCMKKQGFTYTPHVETIIDDDSVLNLDGEDYALAKKSRQKYGFGNYAAAVYPDDPNVPFRARGGRAGRKGAPPEDHDEEGLTPAQEKAYNIAMGGSAPKVNGVEKIGGCQEKAQTAAYGPALSEAAEKKKENAQVEQNHANGLSLNGDAQLVQLAQQYATCLRGQGIPVTTTQPTGIVTMVRLGQSWAKMAPEDHQLSREKALPLLTKEIGVALKDLECGKKFRAAYFPKEKAHPYSGEGAG